MKKLLFVCHGNICRSPMAEFVMKYLTQQRGVARDYAIASAATSDDDIGSGVHRGTREILAPLGITCAGKRAVQLRRADYDRYDLILGMDRANLRDMRSLFGGDSENKLHLLLEYTGSDRDIADPWYTGNFEVTYRDVVAGCKALLDRLEEQK